MSLRVDYEPGGHHTIIDTGTGMAMIHVRATGLVMIDKQWTGSPFARDWIAYFNEALKLAYRISDRPKPWEQWHGDIDSPTLPILQRVTQDELCEWLENDEGDYLTIDEFAEKLLSHYDIRRKQ